MCRNLSTPSRRRRQERQTRGLFSPERLHVFGIVIENTGFPTAKDDSDPFIGQGPDRSVMPFSTVSLHVVISPGPLALGYGMSGKLMETVPGYRSNPGVFLHLISGIETISVRPHRRLKTWRHCGPCPREAIKDLKIRVLSKYSLDLFVDASNSFKQRTQLNQHGFHNDDRGTNHGSVLGQRDGRTDLLQSFINQFTAPGTMVCVELANLFRFGFLKFFQGWPFRQEIASHHRIEVSGPLQRLREIFFERLGQRVSESGSSADGASTEFNQSQERTALRGVWNPRFHLVRVKLKKIHKELGIGGIILGPTGIESVPITA